MHVIVCVCIMFLSFLMFLVKVHACKINPDRRMCGQCLVVYSVFLCCFLLVRFPGVPTDLQEENGVQYVFEVYESTNH